MQTAMLNTLEYVKLLTSVGFSQIQAEGLNEAQNMASLAILSQVATSADLKDLRMTTNITNHEVRVEINELRTENRMEFEKVRSEINELRTENRMEFEKVRSEINELRTENRMEFEKVRSEINELRIETRAEFKNIRSEMHKEIAELKQCITQTSLKNFLGLTTIMGLGLVILGFF